MVEKSCLLLAANYELEALNYSYSIILLKFAFELLTVLQYLRQKKNTAMFCFLKFDAII